MYIESFHNYIKPTKLTTYTPFAIRSSIQSWTFTNLYRHKRLRSES